MAKPSAFSPGFGPGFGVGRYRYALTPWVWDTVGLPHWRLPTSSVGGVDLRPLAAQALAGGTPQGFAFAASMQPVGGVEIVTALHMSEENATSGMQDAWQAAMSYRPQGAKLVDLLFDQLTTGSDPDGLDGPKPLLPTVGNVLELHVGGHSLVKSEQFRFGIHPHTGKVRDLLRRDFERLWEATNGHDHCRRVLDYTCKKYKVDDWKEFVPGRLHAHVPGRLPHATTITDNFTRANGDTIGNLLTWTEARGDWDTLSNQVTLNSSGLNANARAESDLSSDDHYAQIVAVTATGEQLTGVAARHAAAANTYYQTGYYASDGKQYLTKVVTGTLTHIDNDPITFSAGDVMKVECDGSAIKGYQDGVMRNTATDTAITGNTRCGLAGYTGGGTSVYDDFEAADLAAPPTSNRRRRVLICGAAA